MNIITWAAVKVFLAKMIALLADILAHTSVYASVILIFEEPTIPDSLLKKQNYINK
ncbi:hypothetical protein [Alkaliphilus sp. B6464]|uniref:hypothetical protein n=1 Tax=Alkaliphilus sp. B6464 TaxID=2731219 RepID=UPI001BA4CB5B|nr:hypothetical protein [Alkaliphilus sp. B6464]QUH21731.1 hypothetical protein HYG84_18420 [Alkaliphilus sp. B6464]